MPGDRYDIEARADELADTVSDDEDYRRHQCLAALRAAHEAGRREVLDAAVALIDEARLLHLGHARLEPCGVLDDVERILRAAVRALPLGDGGTDGE